MSLKLEYDLTIEQTQKLVMTPELIQAIKILQFNIQELDSYVQNELLENPVLEKEEKEESEEEHGRERHEPDPIDWKEHIRESAYGDGDYRQWKEKREEGADVFERYVADETTLPEYLLFQLQFMAECDEIHDIGKYIIETLDDNGYMTQSVDEIAANLSTGTGKVRRALEKIQMMDPAGVGASDIRECLIIQLRSLGLLTEELETMIRDHLEDLGSNRLSHIGKAMGISVARVQELTDVIRTLEPKPGRSFAGGSETRYVIPDIIVEKTDDGYAVNINETSTPTLKVSSYYKNLLGKAEDDKQLADYLSDKVNSAMWLIRSIDQRKQTIRSVAEAIVEHQKEFFDRGSRYMKTLTLKDIAEEVGVHESTVSRSINGKYLQCCHGVFELRHFFSAGVSDSKGQGVSSSSVKEYIKEIIDGEDPAKPYSDQAIVGFLKEKGLNISRRTVAKYRDDLQILSSSGRRRY